MTILSNTNMDIEHIKEMLRQRGEYEALEEFEAFELPDARREPVSVELFGRREWFYHTERLMRKPN